MNEVCAGFAQALAEAEHQLHWGTDFGRIEQAACDLRALDPGHVLVRHLLGKLARLAALEKRIETERRSAAAGSATGPRATRPLPAAAR